MIGFALGGAVAVTVVVCRRKREARVSGLSERVGISGRGWLGIDDSRERRSRVCGNDRRDGWCVGGILMVGVQLYSCTRELLSAAV